MPPGVNANNNLNLFIFEVGMIHKSPLPFIPDIVQTVSIHPLVVVPTTIGYEEGTRSTVQQTVGGAILTRSGRALSRVNFSGTFGNESRGLLLYIGTGEVRFQRFLNEVVFMPEAMNGDDVKAAIDDLRGTPFIRLLVKSYDPDRTTFYVNFYDFWNARKFECLVEQFRPSRQHRQGGASGLIAYQMSIQEVGPVVVSPIAGAILGALFAILTTWAAINQVITSYTIGAILGSLTGAAGIITGQIDATMNAIDAQLKSAGSLGGLADFAVDSQSGDFFSSHSNTADLAVPATAIMSGASGSQAVASSNADEASLSTFLAVAAQLAASAIGLADRLKAENPTTVDNETGQIDWSAFVGEGSNRTIEAFDENLGLTELADAAAFQGVVGTFYGQDRETYRAFMASLGGSDATPSVKGSIDYRVKDTDTPAGLEEQFGVTWDTILSVNQLLPDEALLAGTLLTIPRMRNIGPQQIDGLPTFGSHAGKAAWGADLTLDLDVDATGRLVAIDEEAVLQQGADFLVELFSDDLMDLVNQVPDVQDAQERMLQIRLERLMLGDKRFVAVEEVDTVRDDLGFDISVTISAINGGEIRTGSPQL